MPRGASLTAEWVCLFRALEANRRPAERVLDDPYAIRFLSGPLLAAARSPTFSRLFRVQGPLSFSRVTNYVIARHRFMDDALAAALAGGATQVVLLGAGYDTRGHRFAAELGGRALFEVDFPATQDKKRGIVGRHPDMASESIRYVAVDFERDALSERLYANGFAPGERTFFVWEGVSMYLARATVQQTLRSLAELAGAGSELVCDLYSEPSSNKAWAQVIRAGANLLRVIGEPIDFTIPHAEAPEFFREQGWEVVDAADSKGLVQRFLSPRRQIAPPFSVVHARL